MDNRPIGIFDSGVGGLTVLKELLKNLPNENYIYFGDTKRAPYGNHTIEILKKFAFQIMDFLVGKNCKAVLIACNTISANVLDEIKKNYPDILIVDVITPTIDEIVKLNLKSIGVLATKATIESGAHKLNVKKRLPEANVYTKACPLFVQIIEEDMIKNEIPYLIAKEYFKDFDGIALDSLILGCTHYPIIEDDIKKALGLDVKILNPAYGASIIMKKSLSEKNMLSENSIGNLELLYSGGSNTFDSFVEKVLSLSVESKIHQL